jgi:hypothetical protein
MFQRMGFNDQEIVCLSGAMLGDAVMQLCRDTMAPGRRLTLYYQLLLTLKWIPGGMALCEYVDAPTGSS